MREAFGGGLWNDRVEMVRVDFPCQVSFHSFNFMYNVIISSVLDDIP